MATTIPNRTALIVSPHLYLGDVTGRPLDYGRVYFGEPNKDGEFYPIDIFSDKELTEPLAQPVYTKGGFLHNNGDITEVFAYEGVYSVKVLDQYGRKIFFKGEVAKQTIEDATSDVVDAAQVEINKRMAQLDNAINTAAAAGAGANGWTDQLVTTSGGRTQRDKNRDYITPFDFGAVGDGQSHKLSTKYNTLANAQKVYPIATSLNDEIDWCALQSMFDYAKVQPNNRKATIDWSGNFHLNKGLRYILNSSIASTRTINGDFNFTIREDFDQTYEAVVHFHGEGITQSGVIAGDCSKRVKYGLLVSSKNELGGSPYINFGNRFDRIFINGAILFAVYLRENSMFCTLNFYRGGWNGSGSALTKMKTEYSNKVDSGVGSLGSVSTLTVKTLPTIKIDDSAIFISANGLVSRVRSINEATKTITVSPHIVGEVTGEIGYIYGGGVRISGSDSASCLIGQMSVIGSGISLHHDPMYSATINSFTSEFAGIAVYEEGLVGGANILTHYFEGDEYEYVNNAEATETYGSTSFYHGTLIDLSKVQYIRYGRDSDGTQFDLYAGALGLSVKTAQGYTLRKPTSKLPNNVIPNSALVTFNEPHEHKFFKTVGDIVIAIAWINTNVNKLFAYDSQEISVVGTGANGSPTGAITVKPLEGYTLNGGTDNLIFRSFSAVAHFKFFLNVATKDIQVSVSGINAFPAVPMQYIATGDTATLPVNTKYYFAPSTGVTGLPMPSANAIHEGSITTIYATGYDGVANVKKQIVEYPQLFETWERVQLSSVGGYFEWQLVSYQPKKGTTAQRPINPRIGMRYYDTTLASSGKPIEFNGTNWIDVTGATV